MDYLKGKVLINNKPISRLPEEITNEENFIKIFKDFIFDVSPLPQDNGYVTKKDKNNRYFTFIFKNKKLTIIENNDIFGGKIIHCDHTLFD